MVFWVAGSVIACLAACAPGVVKGPVLAVHPIVFVEDVCMLKV
jgi:hypothetical protein